jgi:ribulose-phosphate 3-epimerase
VAEALDLVDHLLVMTVNPGRGGQKFITTMAAKVREARELIARRGLTVDVEVDGGISPMTAATVASAGANLLVAGSAVQRDPRGRAAAIRAIREAAAGIPLG